MLNQELKTALERELKDCYDDLMLNWLEYTPAELIADAEEIAAVKLVRTALADSLSDEDAAFLLTLDNPLTAMSGKYMEENGSGMAHGEDFLHCVWSLRQEQEASNSPAKRDPSLPLARQALRRLAAENYDGFMTVWQTLSPAELIEKSAEIASVQEIRAALEQDDLDQDSCEMLLRLPNPLDSISGLTRTFLEEELHSDEGQTPAQKAVWLVSHVHGHGGSKEHSSLRAQLNQRVESNYHALLEGWKSLSPTALIEQAAEIAAIREAHAELGKEGLAPGVCRALLRYPKPLETIGGITRTFMDEAFLSPGRETRFQRAVQYLHDNQAAELSYERREPAGRSIGEVTF